MFNPLPLGFMFCYSLVEFLFIYDNDVGQAFDRKFRDHIVLKLNVVKDFQESPNALSHQFVIITRYAFNGKRWNGLGIIAVNNPDQKLAVINERKVDVCWQSAELTAIQDEGIAKTVAVAGYYFHLQFICEIMQYARIEVITERNGGMRGNISVIEYAKKYDHSSTWILR